MWEKERLIPFIKKQGPINTITTPLPYGALCENATLRHGHKVASWARCGYLVGVVVGLCGSADGKPGEGGSVVVVVSRKHRKNSLTIFRVCGNIILPP